LGQSASRLRRSQPPERAAAGLRTWTLPGFALCACPCGLECVSSECDPPDPFLPTPLRLEPLDRLAIARSCRRARLDQLAPVTTTVAARTVPPPVRSPLRARTAFPPRTGARSAAGRAAALRRQGRRAPTCGAAPPCSPSP